MIRRLSLTARLTIMFGLVSSTVLLGLGSVIASSLQRHFADQDRDLLGGKVMLVHHMVERISTEESLAELANDLRDAFIGHPDLAVLALAPDGRVLYGSNGVRFPAERLSRPQSLSRLDAFEWADGPRKFRGLAVAIKTRIADAPPAVVAVAVDIAHHTQFMKAFRRTLSAFVVGAALISALLGWLAVCRGLAPVRAMKARASAVTASRLDQRLPVESVPIEFADLAYTLNEMLARLEDAFQRLSDFSSDIAHELRTPISNLMTQTQVELSRARDPASYRELLASNGEEFERLARMISDMLFLAKAEHGLTLPSIERIAIEREVEALFDFYDALAEERGVEFQLSGTGELQGDRPMLRRALSNLLSNALRYATAGSCVRVSISTESSVVRVVVENQGPTIDPAHIPHLFDRFYRADKARSHEKTDGTGLGLAITKAIVIAHGGSVAVSSMGRMTSFYIVLPANR